MLLKSQKISAAHSALCPVFMNQKQILHFVLQNSSRALECNNLYLPSTFSPQIWKRVNISTLLQSAEMDWCASVYLCFMAQRKLWAERTEACSKPLTCQPAGTATALQHKCWTPIWRCFLGGWLITAVLNSISVAFVAPLCAEITVCAVIDTALNGLGWSVTSTCFVD